MTTKKFQLEPLTCPSCIAKIERKLGKMDGVEEAKVMFNSSKVKATFNDGKVTADEIKGTIEKLGYPVIA
ncbi:heavy-metal-associated domain-containing protein [Virgibacillus sp. NKC19-16]|uniref:heavy-metal-associated domain-containing protein n=1 Tax=Virgibacillus salidurans TaxID=2831673 RepID=UPI001F3840F3|nr:heavy-metal-associated domain-containing protein [Virgibacillus sp. NKC19-16]UJL46695.1 heavy-metal-associated domain-containing protein [Virgibacillus sp. NKC19-16]